MIPHYEDPWLTIYIGDARTTMADIEPASVHMVCTSPPYWGLRSYLSGDDPDKVHELGLEATPEAYVAAMVDVFRGIWRVLRADGTVWVNLGDSYAASNASGPQGLTGGRANRTFTAQTIPKMGDGLKPKDLVGIPWMVAFALRADGWFLRSDIIWSKPNPMPESVTDRPTKAHEYVFLLSKSPRYYFDADAVREPSNGQNDHDLTGQGYKAPGQSPQGGNRRAKVSAGGGKQLASAQASSPSTQRRMGGFNDRWSASEDNGTAPVGRNIRSVWTIATTPYPMVKLPNGVGADGTPDKVSPDCPVHSPQAILQATRTAGGDGPLGPDPSRSPDTDSRPALAPASGLPASSSLGSRDARPATPDWPDLESSDSPTPGSAPESRTPSLPTADDARDATARPEGRTSRSQATPTSPVGAVLSGPDAPSAIRRNGHESRTIDESGELGSSVRSMASHTRDTDAANGAHEARCSCPKYISSSHFATFPRKLVEPCIKAGTSERGVCPECGAPWLRETSRSAPPPVDQSAIDRYGTGEAGIHRKVGGQYQKWLDANPTETTGWRPTCAHYPRTAEWPSLPSRASGEDVDAYEVRIEPQIILRAELIASWQSERHVPATVLDPFAGSGTVGMVAQSLSRRAVLIDLSPDYLLQQMKRNAAMPLGL